MSVSDYSQDNAGSAGYFAGELFKHLHNSIVVHESGVIKGEVEAIHDMRVSIRRLRVAMRNFAFCLDPDERARLRSSLKQLNIALGVVRDLDVLIRSVESELRSRSPEDRPAIKSLIKRLKSRRRRNMKKLTAYISGDNFSSLKNEFSSDSGSRERHGQAA